jgi:signal transduction histidine kinase
MNLSLRQRVLLTLVPQLCLLAVLGGAAAFLLHVLGGRIDAILRENYRSVVYMDRLKESLERIDSSFTLAMAGPSQEKAARRQFDDQWKPYLENLHAEQENITLPGEAKAVEKLTDLTDRYRVMGEAFYGRPPGDPARAHDYFGENGLLATFKEIKDSADEIYRLNQNNMQQASHDARRTAQRSVLAIGAGVIVATLLSAWLARRSLRAILRPVQDIIHSVRAVGTGNLDQVVPVTRRDELGELADEFNSMARQLRSYRQSGYSRLLRAQRTSQATIDSFPDPVLVVDPEWHVEMANPAAQHLFGVAGRGPDEKPLVAWQPPEPLREPLRESIQAQRPYLPEGFDHALVLVADRAERSFLPRILPIRDPFGQTLGAAVLLLDVTRYRLLDQVKGDLVSTASHELKTPLTSLRLAIHVLLEEIVGPLTAKQAELLVDARDNAERLLAMVNNLLDLARLERGREHLDIQPIQPDELLEAAAEAVRPRAQDKGIELLIEPHDELPAVAADRRQIEHALTNLLDNAVTYTDRGGRITLSAASDGDRVTLTVADSGVGIPAEHLAHVFDRFFRIPGQSRETGTGLGLAIVHEIVTAHGGNVSCDSVPGSGSVFRFTLPAWQPAGADVVAAASGSDGLGRREEPRGNRP